MSRYMRVCPVCGEKFLPAPEHVYKTTPESQRLVCTYSCMMKYRREAEQKTRRRKKGYKNEDET